MKTPTFEPQRLLDAFEKKNILHTTELLKIAGCSSTTAWRLLTQVGYLTSYNHNARYYTLASIPQFDALGLWHYRKARFSKWGSLANTLVGLVQESSAGLTANQLQQLLYLKNVKPHLTRLIQKQQIQRHKIDACFVYFAVSDSVREKQQQQRIQDAKETRSVLHLPPPEHIVALLVEIITRPENTRQQWIRHLARRGVRLAIKDIQAVFEHYQIDLKKGV